MPKSETTQMMITPLQDSSTPRRPYKTEKSNEEEKPTIKSLETIKLLNTAQYTFITQKTPPQFIKKRPGPGGQQIDYVEVGYIINILNQAFGWDWDFKILDQQIGKRQVWVRGELTVRAKNHSITKAQYGGADIKFNRANEPISIADDLKAAASDCLKKCASMLGIAGDIYWRDLDNWESFEQESSG